MPSAVLDAIVRSQGCRTPAPADAHHSARSSVLYGSCSCLQPCHFCPPSPVRTSPNSSDGWPGTWMKSTCQPHCQWQQRRPSNKLRQLKPQAHTRRRHRRCTTKQAPKCLHLWVTLCYLTCMFLRLCRAVCNSIQQCIWRACCASCSQSGYTCETNSRASNSATATSYRMGWGRQHRCPHVHTARAEA